MTRRTKIMWRYALVVGATMAATHAYGSEAAPGWLARTVPTPDVVQGGVVATPEGALLVGQGGFGPGAQRIVRIDATGATTIADGFGSLGGFSLADDGTLYVVDNCFEGDFGCDGATTGDTVYAIPDALARTEAIGAADAELLPAGAIPDAFDVLAHPSLGLLVSDAAGPGAGRVLRIADGGETPVIDGLDFVAGLAARGERLFVGNVDAGFVGSVRVFEGGTPPGEPLADDLSGAFGVAASADRVFVTGGFTDDFASSTVIAVDDAGSVVEIGRGFDFTGGVAWEPERHALHLIDFGARAVTVLCEDADADGACDTACPGRLPARLRAVIGLPGDGTGPIASVRGKLRVGRGRRPDPAVDGLAIGVTSATGTVIADWLVPGGDGWERRGKRWRWSGAEGDPVSDVTVRRRGRRLVVDATFRLAAVPHEPFSAFVAVRGSNGACGGGDFDALVAARR